MRKKVFISYAHHDSTPFTVRLASELEHYYEAFWDNKLQAGAWSLQLEAEIRSCDAFTVVMSHEREKSDACKWELEIAQDQCTKSANQPLIIPVKAFHNYEDPILKTFQYVNFTPADHYNEGFRRLTYMISGERLSAWEYLAKEYGESLLRHLKDGHLPGLIAREFADWIVVDQLWDFFYNSVLKKYKNAYPIYRRTPEGILASIPILYGIAHSHIDSIIAVYTKNLEKTLKVYIDTCKTVEDTNPFASGLIAYEIYNSTRQFCMEYTGSMDVPRYAYYQSNFSLDVAEKLRELIILYARRSRHLY